MKSIRRLLFIGLYLGLAVTCWARPSEYAIKAAYLSKIPKFVEWPAKAFLAPATPLRIGILGQDPFGPTLEALIKDVEAQGHKLEIKHFQQPGEVQDCHILFVSTDQHKNMDLLLEHLSTSHTLTVGETDDFVRRGGAIRFFVSDERVQLEVNIGATQCAGLKVSSRFLKIAKIFDSAPCQRVEVP